jgi:hypothetical protein
VILILLRVVGLVGGVASSVVASERLTLFTIRVCR